MLGIFIKVLEDFWSIFLNFFQVIWNDLVFRSPSKTLEELVIDKSTDRVAMIRSQQDSLRDQAGIIQARDRIIHDLQDRIARKDKSEKRLIKNLRSLEFRLRDQTFRYRRRR